MEKIKSGLKFRFIFLIFLFSISFGRINAQNCTVNAGIPETLCHNEVLQLKGNADGLFSKNALWSQIAGPTVNITNSSALNSGVTGYISGQVYTFRISATCADGVSIYDDVNFTINEVSIANAGIDQQSCPGAGVISLNANVANPNETGTWSIISNDGGVSGLVVSNPNSIINLSALNAGSSILRWSFQHTNGCSSFDDVEITNNGGIFPVFAGNDLTLSNCYTTTQTANLSGSFAGNNTGGQQGTWSLVSGPNYPVFGNIHSNNTSVSNLVEGVYVFRWEVSGPCINGNDEITITVPKATQSLTGAYALDSRYCYGASTVVLEGAIPLYANEVGTWSQIGGPGGITISNPNSPMTSVNGLDGSSTYRFRYIITNVITGCSTRDNSVIRFSQAPIIDVGQDQVLACGSNSVLISPSFTGGTNSRYKIISGPFTTPSWIGVGNGNITINNLNSEGTYTIQFERYSNGVGCTSAFDNINVTISEAPTLSNAGTDQILACSVVETDLAGNPPSEGIGTWSQVRGPNTAIIANTLAESSHISNLIEGEYIFRWVISGGNNCPVEQDEVKVIVSEYTPAVAAGNDRTVCHSTEIKLEGNTPKPGAIGTWTVSPYNGIIFSNSNDPNSSVLGMQASTEYTFTWTISNQCQIESADVKITTGNTAGPSPAFAGPDQCESTGTITLNMNGNNPSVGSGNWTILSGPNTPAITDIFSPTTEITGMVDGHYLIEWSINVPGCISTRDTLMASIVSGVTQANAGADESVCGNSVILSANSPGSNETGRWQQLSGNSGYTISNIYAHDAIFSNLLPGRYEFEWIIEKGICPTSTDALVITVTQQPDVSLAATDFAVCGGTSANLSANNPNSGVGVWSVVGSASNSPLIASINSPVTTVSNLVTGSYQFRWTITTGADCSAQTDDIIIQVSAPAVAEPDRDLCNITEAFLAGTSGSDGIWSVSPINTGVPLPVINNTNVHTATVSGMALDQTYTFRYTVPAIFGCPPTFDDLTIGTSQYGTTPDAGPDQEICLTGANSVFMVANLPGTGSGHWYQNSGPNTANIVDAALNNTEINGLVAGIYVFEWNVDYNHCGYNSDLVRVTVSEPPTPSNAGPDQINACQLNAQLAGNLPATGIGTWSLISAPSVNAASSLIINNPNLPGSSILNISDLGIYTFRWTTSNGSACPTSSNDVNISFLANPPTIPNAGIDQDLCSAVNLILAGNSPSSGIGTWSQISGPSGIVISNPNNNNANVTGIIAGTYQFQWQIVSGGCILNDIVTIVNSAIPPLANASGTDSDICQFDMPLLIGNNPGPGTGQWSFVSGTSTPIISSPDNSISNVTGTQAGAYTFRWTISNGACAVSFDDVTVNITSNPLNNLAVTGNTVCQGVDGTIVIQSSENLVNYELYIAGNSISSGVGNGGNISVNIPANELSIGNNYIDITATNSTGCSVNLINRALITVNPIPLQTIAVSNDEVCENSTAKITLTNTQTGVRYDAIRLADIVGTCTGNNGNSEISILTDNAWIGLNTITLRATNLSTNCFSDLNNQSIIIVNANPLTNKIVTGNSTCLGTNGTVNLTASENGVIYDAYIGATLVGSGLGNGTDINISISSAELKPGNNVINFVATNSTSACSVNLTNQATIVVVNSPLTDRIILGSTVCQNSNASVTISASESNVNYQLYKGFNLVGNGIGTGNDLSINVISSFLALGTNNIDIIAVNASTCSVNLNNQAIITVNQNPDNLVHVTGNDICEGNNGQLSISLSEPGISYSAYKGNSNVGIVIGNGNNLDINILSKNLIPGTNIFDIIATNTISGCSVTLSDKPVINVNLVPANNNLVNGNSICYGNNGIVTVVASENGTNYQALINGSIVGTGIGNSQNLDIFINPTYLKAGDNPINIRATNLGCVADLINKASIRVNSNPKSNLLINGDEICENNQAQISINLPENNVVYEAYLATSLVGTGAGNSGNINLIIEIPESKLNLGSNLINIIARNLSSNCSVAMDNQANIFVNPNPISGLAVSNNETCYGDQALFTISVSETDINYEINVNGSLAASGIGNGSDLDISIPASSLKIGMNSIHVVATNQQTSCSIPLDNNGNIEYKYCDIIVYDGFSPNDDGINETFIIDGLERYPGNKVLIFNRWGNKVYEASPYLNDWDGTNMFGLTVGGKDLPVGTYFYIIEPGNGEKAIKGYIYLTR